MNKFHQEILDQIKREAKKGTKHTGSGYVGNGDIDYPISVPQYRAIIKNWANAHKGLNSEELTALIESLYQGKSHQEKVVPATLLICYPNLRKSITPKKLNDWLKNIKGWSQVDALCTNVFPASELKTNWFEWEKLLRDLAVDDNINKRRASLVFLVLPVRRDADKQLSLVAFRNIDVLKSEREILITKAISWLLRSLVTNHRAEVIDYLEKNKALLPAIATRETQNKLRSGRKSGKLSSA